jgi:hypothetical protein
MWKVSSQFAVPRGLQSAGGSMVCGGRYPASMASIATDIGPLTGLSPRSIIKILPPPFFPSRKARANSFGPRARPSPHSSPNLVRAACSSSPVILSSVAPLPPALRCPMGIYRNGIKRTTGLPTSSYRHGKGARWGAPAVRFDRSIPLCGIAGEDDTGGHVAGLPLGRTVGRKTTLCHTAPGAWLDKARHMIESGPWSA